MVEKESSIQVLRYSGDWKDVGTWNMMAEVMADKTKGKVILDETCENTNVVNELNIPILCMDASFQVLMCLDGYGEVQTMDAEQRPMRFSKGETLFLPAGLGRCLVVGDAELIKVRC